MAATVTEGPHVITLTVINADWVSGADYNVLGIIFSPGLADDILVVKSETDAGAIIAMMHAPSLAPVQVDLYGIRIKPMIDLSACTLNAGHLASFIIK